MPGTARGAQVTGAAARARARRGAAISLSLLTPLGLLSILAVVVPLASFVFARRRADAVAAALGLGEPGARRWLPLALAATACTLFALAAAQPYVRQTHQRSLRTDSEVFFVVDVSRSMLARGSATAPTRLARAKNAAETLRGSIPSVRAGLAGLTDRVLPYLFPTGDESAFASTLRDAVLLETPPPQEVSRVASTLGALGQLTSGFFTPGLDRRTCVVLTDGESRSFSADATGRQLAGPHGCRLLVVQVWSGNERVYGADGKPEPQYRPDAGAPSAIASLARAAGGASFRSGDLGGATGALRNDVGTGPARPLSSETRRLSLAPWLALAGVFLIVLVVGSALPLRVRAGI